MFGLSKSDKLKNELSDLRESVQRIEHAFRMLQVEWSETYDKFRQLHWRVAKRAKDAERLEELQSGEQGSPQGEETQPGGGEDSRAVFTPAQLEAQRKVLARRHGGRTQNGGN